MRSSGCTLAGAKDSLDGQGSPGLARRGFAVTSRLPGPRWVSAGRWATRQIARLLPLTPIFAAIEQAGTRYARLAFGGRLPLPRSVRNFPLSVASRVGCSAPTPACLVERRLVFVLTRVLLCQALRTQAPDILRRLPPVDMQGVQHLEQALARRRGVVLISGHFGVPELIRPLLDRLGARFVIAGARPFPGVDVAVGRDVWTRAQGLQHLRTALGEGHACIVFPDTRIGRHVETPFLAGRIRIGLGAFALAQLAGSPLLPFFAVHLERPPRFRLEVLPPLPPSASSGTPPTEAVSEFVRIYETYARSHPHQISGLQPIFDDGPAVKG
jgi:lipid A biosynthesis acyltransferase